MFEDLTPEHLAPLIETRPDAVSAALDMLHGARSAAVTLEAVQVVADGSRGRFTPASLLLAVLADHGLGPAFLACLRARGANPLRESVEEAADRFDDEFLDQDVIIGDPADDSFSETDLTDFIAASKGFRVRIKIGGKVQGSGALISPRLVLTAGHVVERVRQAQDDGDVLPLLQVRAADGRDHFARLVWYSPCHPREKRQQLPPRSAAATHADAALLRLDRPLGRILGHLVLPDPPSNDRGARRFVLVHFPGGKKRGIAIGRIRREGPEALREFHNVNTEQGSSGGPGFDRNLGFIGLHQGRWANVRRIVPYGRFADNPGFRAERAKDRPPRYLWSLDGSLDSSLIIGRSRFFDAVTAIAEDRAPLLRGVWIRRIDPAQTEGLSFSHRVLRAFLAAWERKFETLRLPTGHDVPDPIAMLATLHDGGAAPDPDPAAIGNDPAASAARRAQALAGRMAAVARAAGRPRTWIYVEAPPNDLAHLARLRLEHLVGALLRHPELALVLVGFETQVLPALQYGSIDEANGAPAPGLLAEYLGRFTREDVDTTARRMNEDLALGWNPTVRAHMVTRVLRGIRPLAPDLYGPENLGEVAERLRVEAAKDLPQ